MKEHRLTDLVLRALAAAALSVFAMRALGAWWANPIRITVLFLFITETVTVVLVLIARLPERRDWRPLSVALTLAGTFYFLALDLVPGRHLIPEWAGGFVQCVSLLWQIYAKVSLGRSFGLLPADRGVVTTGAYRVVRHPIYLGYFAAHMAFLLVNFDLHNLIVFAALYLVQGLRLMREESLLRLQPAYRDYCRKVRFRMMPPVF